MTAASAPKPQEFWYGLQFTLPNVQKMLLAVPRLQAAGVRAALNQQRELLAFLTRRCDQDLQLADRIAHADEVKDIYDAMLRFCEGAAKEYTAEAGKVAEIGSHAANEAIRSIKQEAEAWVEPGTVKKVA